MAASTALAEAAQQNAGDPTGGRRPPRSALDTPITAAAHAAVDEMWQAFRTLYARLQESELIWNDLAPAAARTLTSDARPGFSHGASRRSQRSGTVTVLRHWEIPVPPYFNTCMSAAGGQRPIARIAQAQGSAARRERISIGKEHDEQRRAAGSRVRRTPTGWQTGAGDHPRWHPQRADPAAVPAALRAARAARGAARLPDRARHAPADVGRGDGPTRRRLGGGASRTLSRTSQSSTMPGIAPAALRDDRRRSRVRRSSGSPAAC